MLQVKSPPTNVRSDKSEAAHTCLKDFIRPTSYRFGEDREQFSVSLVRQQTSNLITVTTAYSDGGITLVDREDRSIGLKCSSEHIL